MVDGPIKFLGTTPPHESGKIQNLTKYGKTFSIIDQWIEIEGYPDLIIVGGASGVDYLAERWATNSHIEFILFNEFWDNPRPGLEDSGRDEAPLELTAKLLEAATHVLAFLSRGSKWTKVVADEAHQRGIPTYVHHLDESE